MDNLVGELQSRALDSDRSVSDLLRTAKIAAAKLDLDEFRKWVDSELNGYDGSEVPNYRVLEGQLKAFNPYQGRMIPAVFPSDDLAKSCTTRRISQKISEIEILAKSAEKTLMIPISDEQQLLLGSFFKVDLEFRLLFSPIALGGIIDSVRNTILDWSLKLEENGIKGEGMAFSKEEKTKAHSPNVTYQINSIGNFTGNIGSLADYAVVNASSSASLDHVGLQRLMKELRQYDSQFGLNASENAEMNALLKQLEDALKTSDPKPTQVGALLGGLKKVLSGAASGLLVHGAIAEIDKYIHLIPHF